MEAIKKLESIQNYAFPAMGEIQFEENEAEIYATRDRKAFFLLKKTGALVHFPTKIGVQACYEYKAPKKPEKIKAVLMDLDGTSIKSEPFWVWVIEEIIRRITGREDFKFEEEDLPFVSGFSVSEHLSYALEKYCSNNGQTTLGEATKLYFEIVRSELQNIVEGKGRKDAFLASHYLKEFLLNLKENNIRIGVVSSGLYEKAWPEMKCVFDCLGLGDPLKFYDAIVTAGFPIQKDMAGTIGELAPKPHPWLYSEALFALGLMPEEVIAFEDSNAGILAATTAGIATIGIADGNIEAGGGKELCLKMVESLEEAWEYIKTMI